MRRCPKCGSYPCAATEMWTGGTLEFDIDTDGKLSDTGNRSEGFPSGVFLYCSCGYSWRARGILQITQLKEEEE